MKTQAIFLLFVAAALNGVTHVEGGWGFFVSESQTMEVFDDSEEPADVDSTAAELREAVVFNLFTSSNPDQSQILYIDDDETLAASYFDPSKPTRFFIHGWLSSVTGTASIAVRDGFLAAGDYNVIIIDWSAYAGLGYLFARTKIVAVGTYVGEMIDYLESQGMDINDLIVTGHSLGAHLAGVSSRSATNTVPALIALDPAGPLFYFTDTKARLRSTDAEFVQVVHTNTALLGYNSNLGDVDFWPNGGDWQAGCTLDVFGTCSHARSYYFIAESLANAESQFVAYSCDSYSNYAASSCSENTATHMGGATLDTSASGDYYLTTNSASPYAMG